MYQVRSEETGVRCFSSLSDAISESKKDTTIWKISYFSDSGKRIRMVKQSNGDWKEESLL